jgi:hypothetical protein
MILRSALLAFEDEHAQEHDAEQRNPLFRRLHAQRKRPVAIRPLDGTGKVPVTDDQGWTPSET